VLLSIAALLSEQELGPKDIDRIAVHAGPARRTSALRAGVTVANLLASSAGISLVEAADPEKEAGFVGPKY
jgi:tRNA A37 threonylcarbamoyladenosine modification protein TsaB